MATLTAILKELQEENGSDDIRLNDGADTWDIFNLLDYSDDGREYYYSGTAIYAEKEDGYLNSVPSFTITRGECGE